LTAQITPDPARQASVVLRGVVRKRDGKKKFDTSGKSLASDHHSRNRFAWRAQLITDFEPPHPQSSRVGGEAVTRLFMIGKRRITPSAPILRSRGLCLSVPSGHLLLSVRGKGNVRGRRLLGVAG